MGGGGGGLLLTGAGAGATGLLLAGTGLLLTVEGTGLLDAGFCSTLPAMAFTPMDDPSLIAGLPLFLRSRNLSSSFVAGADCGPLKAGAFIGPCD